VNELTGLHNKTEDTDIFGKALIDYGLGYQGENLLVYSDLTDTDIIPVKHFFRQWSEMPEIEQEALKLCSGKILDVGAAAGCHSLELQKRNKDTIAIDVSKGAVEVMKKRGVRHVQESDFFRITEQKFDTLLLLMNGIGICGTLDRLDEFFEQCRNMLNPGGQILLDSSDILFMFEEEDGSVNINLNSNYYGEVEYRFGYKSETGPWFSWLFIDFDLLQEKAAQSGFNCEMVFEGPHYDYLARLTRNDQNL
jgi:SAM-dependent methyltransferase